MDGYALSTTHKALCVKKKQGLHTKKIRLNIQKITVRFKNFS